MTTSRRIFLAHSREDKPQVRKLYADLKARGLEPWLDEVDLVPGQIWKEEIPKVIRQAGLFLACLSSRSVGKVGYLQNEFRLALAAFGERPPGSIYLIPVRLDDCAVPDLQIPDRGLSLLDIQWVDLWQEGGFTRLLQAIERGLERLADPLQTEGEAPTAIPEARSPAQNARESVTAEVAEGALSGSKARGRARFLQHPTVIAAMIAAIATLAGAALPLLPRLVDRIFGGNSIEPQSAEQEKPPETRPVRKESQSAQQEKPPDTAPERKYLVCVGADESRCDEHDFFEGCLQLQDKLAPYLVGKYCSDHNPVHQVTRLSTRVEGKCGYTIFQLTCSE